MQEARRLTSAAWIPAITDVSHREATWTSWKQHEADRLGCWFLTSLSDGRGADGKPMHWQTYEHLDGRKASVMGGRSTDPELQALLDDQGRNAAGSSPTRRGPLPSAVFALARRLLRSRK